MLTHWAEDFSLVAVLASEFEAFVDYRFLNNPPPTDATSMRLLELTAAHFERAPDADKLAAADALYSVERLSGRAAAALCERAARVFIELKPNDATTWNLGICATGTGQGKLALDRWRQKLGAKLELGDDGLPTGQWANVKVRLAERPAAARTSKDDSPGDEETVWVERLSPCHGRVISPTARDLAAGSAKTGTVTIPPGAGVKKTALISCR